MARSEITSFVSSLDELQKSLIDHYIENDYVPRVRTGLGRRKNFLYEHDSKKGVEIAREILKFKKMQLNSGYIKMTLSGKKNKNKRRKM